MSAFWLASEDVLKKHANWTVDGSKFKLRSTGAGGIIWIEDVTSGDGVTLITFNFNGTSLQPGIDADTCSKWNIDIAIFTATLTSAIEKWKNEA